MALTTAARLRFIPACAGNARRRTLRAHTLPVHPRVCGERSLRLAIAASMHGSSPRVRGTRGKEHAPFGRDRFIPACAGNAQRSTQSIFIITVHPRVCGERFWPVGTIKKGHGSSPRVRGTHQAYDHQQPRNRFIPACAGNALIQFAAVGPQAVHPRVCGERPRPMWSTPDANGSSPRVRGTRQLVR